MAEHTLIKSKRTADHRRKSLMLPGTILLLLLTTVSGFSLGGRIRSPPTTGQTRRFRAAADPATPNGSNADSFRFLQRSPKSKHTSEESDKIEEEAVDEYLEFLDRRYRRLRDKESPSAPVPLKAPFSALNWLKQEHVTDAIVSEQIQDDALYVLGVAGLASKRLLEKHQIPESYVKPIREGEVREDEKPGAIDVRPEIDEGNVTVQTLRKLGNLIAHVTKARQALLAYQTRKLFGLLKASVVAPARLLKKIWAMGGGMHSLAITVTLASVLAVVLIRPLLVAIGKESLNIVSSQ